MRIAVFHNLPPGGALRAVDRQVEYLRGAGHEVDEFSVDVARGVLSAVRLRSTLEVLRLLLVQRVVARQIDRGGYDVVLAHPCAMTQAPAVLFFLGTPSAYCAHEARRVESEFSIRQAWWLRVRSRGLLRSVGALANELIARQVNVRSLRSASCVLVESRHVAETLYRLHGVEARYVPLGIDDVFDSKGPTSDLESGPFVLAVGGVEAHKGHRLAVEAMAEVPEAQRPDLVIVHQRVDPDERRLLEERASTRKVGLRFYQDISDDELAALYRSALATLCLARLEPLGLTPLESAACGTPAIAIAEGGYRETVVPGTGVLVERDARAIAEALGEIRAGSGDDRAAVVVRRWPHVLPILEQALRDVSRGWV